MELLDRVLAFSNIPVMASASTSRRELPYRAPPQSQLWSRIDLEVHLFSQFRGDRRWNFPNMHLPCNAIYLIHGGDGELWDQRRRVRLRPGQAYLLPLKTPLGAACRRSIEKTWGFFSLSLVPGLDLLDGLEGFRELGPFAEGDLPGGLAQAVRQATLADYFALQGFLFQLLASLGEELTRAVTRQTACAARYAGLFQTLHDRLGAGLRVADLAAQCGMTPEGLSRAFRRDMGCTLKSYIQERLNSKACALLAGTDLTVKEVARRLGYDDAYYFTRAFGRRNGLCPTGYRERHRG